LPYRLKFGEVFDAGRVDCPLTVMVVWPLSGLSNVLVVFKLDVSGQASLICKAKNLVTIQLTSDLPDSGVKSAHIHLYTARFILVLEQIRGNLNSYQ
jgi:hypothetical protein